MTAGGAGFIGGHTVLAFLDRGEIPIVLDDLSTGNRAAVPSGVPFFVGDVGDEELVLRLVQNHRIDAILHFAAKIVVPESVADPLNYYHNNTVKTHTLVQAAVRGNVKHFVFSSTAAVYGNPSFTPVSETAAAPGPLPGLTPALRTSSTARGHRAKKFERRHLCFSAAGHELAAEYGLLRFLLSQRKLPK